ncbi:MAG: hypothetical protein EZS28_029042 [Streblomastix strix]|uniref:Dynein heavy chain coiled coil stalk domain-containing protein n=1 Tax=Streblomastix strix TaxID=222440 RepID=A0A5J4UZ50_9EUKA|nr:MAG: hypothetical protein EZS28_029042 [Streblomastix strix]
MSINKHYKVTHQFSQDLFLNCKAKESGRGSAKALIASSSEHHEKAKQHLKVFFENMTLFTPKYSYTDDNLRTIVEEQKLVRQNNEELLVMNGQNVSVLRKNAKLLIDIYYDKDILDEKMKMKLRITYINLPKFHPEVVENVSKAAKSQYSYIDVAKEVQPKRAKVKESMEMLELMQQALAKKKFELHGVEDNNAYRKAKYDASISKKAKIKAEIEATRMKLIRVEKLLN